MAQYDKNLPNLVFLSWKSHPPLGRW